MHIVLCIDDRGGMLFNRRRLSADNALYKRVFAQRQGTLWVNSYSSKLFEKMEVVCDDSFLHKAGVEDTCFVEDLEFINHLSQVRTITVYRWNRHYPSDVKLPVDMLNDWKMIQQEEFTGDVHPTITEEKYIK